MYNINNRIQQAFDKMTIEEQYKLMELAEGENLGEQKGDAEAIESIVNILLEVTTVIAKLFKII